MDYKIAPQVSKLEDTPCCAPFLCLRSINAIIRIGKYLDIFDHASLTLSPPVPTIPRRIEIACTYNLKWYTRTTNRSELQDYRGAQFDQWDSRVNFIFRTTDKTIARAGRGTGVCKICNFLFFDPRFIAERWVARGLQEHWKKFVIKKRNETNSVRRPATSCESGSLFPKRKKKFVIISFHQAQDAPASFSKLFRIRPVSGRLRNK